MQTYEVYVWEKILHTMKVRAESPLEAASKVRDEHTMGMTEFGHVEDRDFYVGTELIDEEAIDAFEESQAK